MLSLQKIIKSAGGPVGLRGSALLSVVTGPPRLCWGMIGAPRPRLELAPRSVWPWAPSCPAVRQHPHLQVSLSPALSSQKVGENSRRGLDHQGLEPIEEIQQIALHSPHRTFQLLCFMTLKGWWHSHYYTPQSSFPVPTSSASCGSGILQKDWGQRVPEVYRLLHSMDSQHSVIHPASSRSLLRK
jgi:hypothetical protein